MVKLSTPILWSADGDLFYLAYLIEQYLDPLSALTHGDETEAEIREFSSFTRRLILLNSGIEPDIDAGLNPASSQPALADFVENFRQLYPHLFYDVPVWVHWMVEAVESEINRGTASC